MPNRSRNQCFKRFRQCQTQYTGLTICLILLQCVIPFLHAHSGIEQSPAGLHIPGYEQPLKDDSALTSDVLQSVDNHQEMIISVGTALQVAGSDELNLDTLQQSLLLLAFCIFGMLPFLLRFQTGRLQFQPWRFSFYDYFLLSYRTPRAPPYLI